MLKLTAELILEIEKSRRLPQWSHNSPPYVETHYHDGILVFRYDRERQEIYCDNYTQSGFAPPQLIEIRYDGQLVFVKHLESVLLNRLPAPLCLTNEPHN